MKLRFPLVLRHAYEALQTENFTLRDALREANAELLKHRILIKGLRTGQVDITRQFERAIATK